MAIDTRNKRASCLRVGRPWMTGFPLPDGGIQAADRKQMAYSYAGIEAQSSASNPITELCLTGQYVTTLSLTGQYVSSLSLTGQYVTTLSTTGSIGVC